MIRSYSAEEPEFCHPACSEDKPCKGKVCPYKGKKESRSSGSQSEGLETKGDIASQEDGPRRSNQSSSLKKRCITSNSDETTEKAYGSMNPDSSHDRLPKGENEIEDSDVGKPQGVTGANGVVIDKRLLWGLVLGIFIAVGFLLLLLFIFYAARKVIPG